MSRAGAETPLLLDFGSRLAPLRADDGDGWDYVFFRGKLEQARQCELLRNRPLPGDAGQNGTSLCFEVDGRRIRLQRRGKYSLQVRIDGTPAEKATAKELWQRRWRDEVDLRKARELLAQAAELEKMQWLPRSVEAFREGVANSVVRGHEVFERMYFEGHPSGFYFDPMAIAQIEGLQQQIVQVLLCARIRSGPKTSSDVLDSARALRAEAARLDPPLQRLLAHASASRPA